MIATDKDYTDRVREFVAMWRGVPKNHVIKYLDRWRSDCGTLACGAGWAVQYPPFHEQGLKYHLETIDEELFPVPHWEYLREFFGPECDKIFSVRDDGNLDRYIHRDQDEEVGDHLLVELRALYVLQDMGYQVTDDRSKALLSKRGEP